MECVLLDANKLAFFNSIDVHILNLSGDVTVVLFDAFQLNQRFQSITLPGVL
jgi:hypothetical protein